ncbi:MAG: tetratricopeptide repeat protein [Sandaracinaceae bacterium]|nr:tetratricopeptide repeat protein [Sandaracinaceae bacterium]
MSSFALPRVILLGQILAGVLSLALPTEASACACCDGGDRADVLGFTDTDAALLERHGAEACEALDRLEVWRARSTSPVRCFDLHASEASRARRCDDWTYAEDFGEPSGASHPRRRFFPHAARYLAPTDIRATLARYEPPTQAGTAGSDDDDDDDEFGGHSHTLVVEVRTASGFEQVMVMDLTLGAPERVEEEGEDEDAEIAIPPPDAVEVHVAVSPGGANLVVLVHGFNSAPGMGHFPTEVRPAAVEGLDAARFVSERPVASLAIATSGAVSPFDEASSATTVARYNRAALAMHRARDYAGAMQLWVRLLAVAPADANVRYNLACALAKLGDGERALELLRDLHARAGAGCIVCRERLRRARRDPDLATVRQLRGYSELGASQPPASR